MNANELADWLDNTTNSEDWGELAKYYKWCKENVAPMLRQQQAENEALKKQLYPTPKEFLGVTPDGVLLFKEEERNDAGFYMSDAEHYKLKCASLQAEIEAVKESNKNLMELVTMLREEVNSLRQQQAENEALKKLFDNCNVSDFTPPQKAIIRQGFEKIWDELWDKSLYPEQTEIINDTLHNAVEEAKKK